MAEYQYPLYFEAHELTDREKDRVRRHFQKKRDSGGGDCGQIERVGDRIYKVCFVDVEAQERVLQRKFHTISLPSGDLYLRVSRTESLLNFDQSSASQTQAFTTSNTKDLEKIFKLDIFLLHYLKNNTKANKVLQKQLDAIYCTVDFNFEEEEAVVRGNIEKGPEGIFSGAAVNWEKQVDQVFINLTERYLCYHVVEPKVAKMLPQDLSAFDDIKVYTETGYPVVVGEKEAVEEKISILQKNMSTCEEVPVVEKNFKLVEEEFSREARVHFPEVKISRRDDMVTLEGPATAVQAGVSKLHELIGKIKKKTVPLDPALLTFVRLSGADSKYQTRFQQSLRNPVALEVGTDLLLSSLSSDALDEAEAVLQRDLSVARVTLQGAAAVPPDFDRLKQLTITAKNQANSRSFKVDVSFTPGLGGTSVVTVQLVGYTENVNILKETLHDFQMNHVETQVTLNLPHPDMVDCFDKILNLIGMKKTKVTITASPFPYPCVLLSGARCEVQEVQASLTSTLASLTLDTLVLDGPGALQYFQGDGRVNMELIESYCQVIIKEQEVNPPNLTSAARSNINPIPRVNCNTVGTNVSTNFVNKTNLEDIRSLTSDPDDITMTVGGGIKLQLVFGNITKETTDAVVNTTDFVHFQNDGVCKDILTVAGPVVKAELKAAKVNQGEIFVTQPGSFPCKGILHVYGENDSVLIEQIVCRIVEYCEIFEFTSVAIPAICAGAGGLDPDVVANAVLRGVKAATSSTTLVCLKNIRLILFKMNVFLAFKKKALEIYPAAALSDVPVSLLTLVQQQQPLFPVRADLRSLQITPISQNSTFLLMGVSRQDVDDAKKKLKDLFEAQCSTQTFSKEELAHLALEDLEDLEDLAKTHGLSMQKDQPSQGCLTVSGLKDGMSQVRQMITDCQLSSLRRQASIRNQEDLCSRVVWCILGPYRNWERLPKKANHDLENRDIMNGIEDAQGVYWRVNLQRSEATCPTSGQKATLKRLENLPDFTFPLYWDNMAAGENMKTFVLQPSSPEYKTVKEAFKRTVKKTVLKIERVQNIHLRRAYEAQKKRISDKNRAEGGAFEKLLFHGTREDNCTPIMNSGFNRSFAGENGTSFGRGTYFAVNASYSSHYSRRLADESQLMFMVRVLTGIYGQGRSDMRVPPPRSNLQPHDLCDSVVDRTDNPTMFVVFHDDQAYPDYLITFK